MQYIEMKQFKVCKHSVRYNAIDENAVIQSVYVLNSFKVPMPNTIIVSLEISDGIMRK